MSDTKQVMGEAIRAGEAVDRFFDRWSKEGNEYVRGSMMASPVGEMNRASADVVRRMLTELRSILAASDAPERDTKGVAMIDPHALRTLIEKWRVFPRKLLTVLRKRVPDAAKVGEIAAILDDYDDFADLEAVLSADCRKHQEHT